MALLTLRKVSGSALINRLYFKRNKYIVLLPEIPQDNAENNPLLKTTELPLFSQLTVKNCINASGKLLIEYEAGIHHLSEKLYDPLLPKNVQNVILPLDRLSAKLDFVWGAFKLLYSVKQHENVANAYMKLHPRIIKAKRERYLSPSIYRAFKELKVDEKQFTEPVQRIIHKHLLESQLSGIELPGHKVKHLQNTILKINEHNNNYRNKLHQSTAAFSHMLDIGHVKEFPIELLHHFAVDKNNPTKGPWKLTLDSHIYEPFMQYCGDRMLRWNAWNASNIRASPISGKSLDNSIEVEEIRHYRQIQADIIGFKNFAEMSMETKMAGSVDNVMAMLTTLSVRSKDSVMEQIYDLQEFANSKGFQHKLELFDIPYWQRRYKEEILGINDHDVSQYFPFQAVLRGIFAFCNRLFGISIQEATPNVDVWHKDVTFYKIYDENEKQVASFFLDPYSREGEKVQGAWMEIGRNRSDVLGADPLAYLIFSFKAPQPGQPCVLTFNDINILLQKFGHLLQHSLTSVPYNDVSGLTNLEWDVVNVCPFFFSRWLSHYNTVAGMSSHVESGNPLSVEMHEKLIKAHKHMSGLYLSKELFFSMLDIELYSRKNYWLDITKNVWTQCMQFPLDKNYAPVCSFTPIICDEFPAAYFSSLWAEMIAADVFNAFEEVGLDNKDAMKQIGLRFRDTYLALGGGCQPSEVFRRFRGRDPSTDALLSYYCSNYKTSSEQE